MAGWLNLGQILKVNAKKFPQTVALKDCDRGLTYPSSTGGSTNWPTACWRSA